MTAPTKRPRGRPRLGVEPSEHMDVRVAPERKRAYEAAAEADDVELGEWVRDACERKLKRRVKR